MLREARRLPGIQIEVQPPSLNDTLPRMDVAAFVGFAASGPLHLPVLIDDVAHFEAIFGRDLALVWDAERGETVYAHLAPAVRAFFRNGGKRCYAIRVADREQAVSNLFPLPGVAWVRMRDDGSIQDVVPAFAAARSPGSWSDGLRVGAGLLVRSFIAHQIAVQPNGVTVQVSGAVVPGDLLRLTYRELKLTVLVAVRTVKAVADASSPPARTGLTDVFGQAIYLQAMDSASESEVVTMARLYHRVAAGETIATLTKIHVPADNKAGITLQIAPIDAPPPGSLIRLDTANGTIWLTVESVRGSDDFPQAAYLEGSAVRWKPNGVALPADLPFVEGLRLDLHTSADNHDPIRLSDLDFAPLGSRFWPSLPDDAAVYDPASVTRLPDPLWNAALNPRFPIAGTGDLEGFAIPFAVTTELLPPVSQTDDPLMRDGLRDFHRDLFVDTKLIGATVHDLMARANFIRYESPNPRLLLDGLHGALALDEVTLICVPDAVHTGWSRVKSVTVPEAEAVPPPYRPDWHRFEECDPAPEPVAISEPRWDQFLDCRVAVIEPPDLSSTTADSGGTFILAWSSPLPDAVYTVEESTEPDFGGAGVIYEGRDERLTLYQRGPGVYYYHARVKSGINVSDWSMGVWVEIGTSRAYRLDTPDLDTPNVTLLSIHRALIRMCAARGDLFAVLTLPENTREDQAIDHAQALHPAVDAVPPGTYDDFPLSYGEVQALSYAALYHPWMIVREEQTQELRRTPPDGTVMGMIAQRSLSRGAWIAPANQRLSGIIALTPTLSPRRWQDLLNAQINIIRSEPSGFMLLSADTLAEDIDLMPIGTRRLLSLLRRLALQLGAQYVFEPNDGVFRRMVQRGFDNLLDQMFTRGAFAGRNPETAYLVVVHDSARDADEGRLIVDLKVAPSLPLAFLTVRLVQNGERGFVINEVR